MQIESLAFFAFVFFSFGLATAYVVLKLTWGDHSKQPANARPESQDENELLRLWLDADGKRLVLQTRSGQKLYLPLAGLALKAEAQPEAPEPAEPPAARADNNPPAPAAAERAQRPQSQPQSPGNPPSPYSAPLTPPSAPAPLLPIEAEKPRPSLVGSFMKAMQSANLKTPDAPAASIARQIDAVLQQQIAGTAWQARGLQLLDLPDHGLGVQLDQMVYAGIDAVPDEEVRNQIRAAVETWQKQLKR